ncbi:MAG: hypothetical protein K2G17_04220, partial [Duncaniella sp.]|nr:hypothetical protein [Duncaniella sp.]
MQSAAEKDRNHIGPLFGVLVGMMIIVLTCPFNIFSETPHPVAPVAGVDSVGRDVPARPNRPVRPKKRPTSPITVLPDSIPIGQPLTEPSIVVGASLWVHGLSLVRISEAT